MSTRIVATACLLAASGCVRSVELPERPEGLTVTGQVVARDLAAGDWRGLPGVSVAVRGSTFRGLTNEDGSFQLDRLPLDVPLVLELEGPRGDGIPARRRVLDPVVGLVDGQALDLGTVRLAPGGTMTGRALTFDDDLPPTGAGGVLVVAVGTAFKAVSDADGAFTMAGLPEGSVDVAAFLPGYRPARSEGVQIRPGSTTTLEDLELEPGEAAAVTVTNTARRAEAAGEDVGHAGINLDFVQEAAETPDDAFTARAITTDDGTYRVELPVGVYRLTASDPRANPVTVRGIAVLEAGVLGLPPLILTARTDGDVDGDGVPDDQDSDRDNDGCADDVDAFPTDPTECRDSDMDGTGDALDDDDDDDGLSDAEELSWGEDGWVTSPTNPDTDGDDVPDGDDVCPTVPDRDQADGDGDGIGDACQDTTPAGARDRPVISSFAPLQAGVGGLVTILGRDLAVEGSDTVVQFGPPPGGLAFPFAVSAERLQVFVPGNARTGPVRVYVGGSSATSTATFTLRSGPEVVSFTPRAGRIGSRVRVIGQDFSAEDLLVSVGEQTATVIPHIEFGPVRPIVIGGARYDAIEFEVPTSTSAPIFVHTAFGSGRSEDDFQVLDGGVEITQLVPSTVTVTSRLRVLGHGFSTDDLVAPGRPVQVIFNAESNSPIAQDILPTSSDGQLVVEVPAGAETGRIAVDHPTLEAPVLSLDVLVVDPQLPSITGASETVVMVGDTLDLFGSNLQAATMVTFAGGAQATPTPLSSGQLQVTVPAGVAAGPVTVTTPNGVAQSTPALNVLTESAALSLPNNASALPGGGMKADGSELYLINSLSSRAYVLANGANGLTVSSEVPLDTVLPFRSLLSFVVAPSGSIAVALALDRAWIVDLPDFTFRASCPLATPAYISAETAVQFDETTRKAWTAKGSNPTAVGFIEIDLDTGACRQIDLTVAPVTNNTLLLAEPSTRTLLLAHPTLGVATVDVDPNSMTPHTFVRPWTLPGVSGLGLTRGLNNQVLVLRSSGATLGYFEPFNSPVQDVLLAEASDGRLDGIGRFLVVEWNGFPELVDTSVTPPVLVRQSFDGHPRYGAPIPGQTAWILSDRLGRSFSRFEISTP